MKEADVAANAKTAERPVAGIIRQVLAATAYRHHVHRVINQARRAGLFGYDMVFATSSMALVQQFNLRRSRLSSVVVLRAIAAVPAFGAGVDLRHTIGSYGVGAEHPP